MDKKALRKSIAAQKRAMTDSQIRRCSDALTELLLATPVFQAARSLYGYLSYNQEVRTDRILLASLAQRKRVAVPKVFGNAMRFIWISDLKHLTPGSYGIPEPVADGPEADDPHALVLMPGLAFDPEGRRIGYGGGFYDRFLEAEPDHPTIALCYDFQVFSQLDTDPHDIPVQQVLWTPVHP